MTPNPSRLSSMMARTGSSWRTRRCSKEPGRASTLRRGVMSTSASRSATVSTVAPASIGQAKCSTWAAAIDSGPPRLGSSSLDVRTTRLRLSACSRPNRSCSSGVPCQLFTTPRSVAEAKSEVSTGTNTITEKAVGLNTPDAQPHGGDDDLQRPPGVQSSTQGQSPPGGCGPRGGRRRRPRQI